jgi:hypothetical protein
MHRSIFIAPLSLLVAVVALAGQSSPGRAADPVAIVEEAPEHTGVVFMDYLDAGYAFELAPGEKFVVNYLKSCLRETIIGGRVVIGFEKSAVKGGQINRDELDCSGRGMRLSPEQSQESGVVVYREADDFAALAASHGTQPLFSPIESGQLIIHRIDAFETPREVEATGSRLDLLALGVTLTPGGIYRLRGPTADFVFAVAPNAKAGNIPLISRLIRP